jgi:hypothetical protein
MSPDENVSALSTGSLVDLVAADAVPVRCDGAVAGHGCRMRSATSPQRVGDLNRAEFVLLASDEIAGDGCRVAESLQFRNIMA